MRACLSRGCGLLLIVLIVAGGYLWWRWNSPPALKPEVPISQLPPEEQRRRRAEVKDLQTRVKEIAAAAHAHRHQEFSLEVTGEELNTMLQDSLAQGRYPVRDLQMELRPDQIVGQGNVKIYGRETTIALAGKVAASKGKLAFTADSLTIQGVPAPSDWKAKAERAISDRLNHELVRSGVHVNEVTTGDGKMTIKGVTD